MKLNFTFKKWHSLILLLFILGFSKQASAATFYSRNPSSATSTSSWTSNLSWSLTSGGGGTAVAAGSVAGVNYPGPDDDVVITGYKPSTVQYNKTITIPINTLLSCKSVTIKDFGILSFVAVASNTSSLTCYGDVICGNSSSKGTLNMSQSTTLTCIKLFLGTNSTNVSTINGRDISSFIFKGSGSDVVPVFSADDTGDGSVTDFSSVTFDPGTGNTVTIPAGFSCLTTVVNSGTLDLSDKWNSFYTGTTGTSMSVLNSAILKIGGARQLPTNLYYIFGNSTTVDFTGSTQTILPVSANFKNLTLSGPGTKTLGGNIIVEYTLDIQDLVKLDARSRTLTISGSYSNEGTGCVMSNASTNLIYKGYANSSMRFDETPNNQLNNLTLGKLTGGYVPNTPGSASDLNLTILSPLDIIGTLTLYQGHLVTNSNLGNVVTLKSNNTKTAMIAPIVDNTIDSTDPNLTYNGIIGDIRVERWIPAELNVDGTNIGRAYRALSSSVTGGTIFSNWQENGSVASLTGSILGNILTTTDPSTPLAVGQHISGNLIPANTTITNIDNAESNEYEISTVQNVASRSMVAYTSIATATVTARFTGSITGNELDVTGFTSGAGTLAVGQKILGGTLANTVITAFVSGTGDTGTYTIGLEIPSETIHYNGAPAGFGTHITGVASTDAQLGQYDTTTGLDFTRSGKPSMFTYDNGWNPVINTKDETNTNPDQSPYLIAGKPYLITIRGDRTIDLASNTSFPSNTILRSTGEIIAGPVEILGLDTTTSNFNFVGNPYQAPVDLSLIYADNTRWADIGNSYTVFDSKMSVKGAYVTYDFDNSISTNGDSVMDNTLEPNQAFFVQTSGVNPILIFNETDKKVASNAYVPMFRKAKTTNSLIRGSVVNAATNKALDGFILAFSDTYNNDIVAEDSQKISNADENFSIKNGANDLVIDKRKNPSENDVIALNLTQERLSDYVLKFEVSNFEAKDAYLVDAYTKKETALKNNQINSYAFKVDATPESAAADRFSIVFKAATSLSINSNSIKELAVYPNPVVDNKFTIRANQDFGGKKATLSIVNTLGQKVYSTNGTFSTDGSIAVKPTNALNKGIYFLKVAVDGKEETKKLIIK